MRGHGLKVIHNSTFQLSFMCLLIFCVFSHIDHNDSRFTQIKNNTKGKNIWLGKNFFNFITRKFKSSNKSSQLTEDVGVCAKAECVEVQQDWEVVQLQW